MKKPNIVIDCSACKSEKAMHPTTVAKFSSIVRFIGYVIAIPSILGALGGALVAILAIVGGAASGDPNVAGAGVVGGAFAGGIIATLSIVSGLIGYLLLGTKNVFRCDNCSFMMDRA